ncbi:MAG TPA: LLM class flavin-dependent oxidoreductase [Pseudomonadales bacterium]
MELWTLGVASPRGTADYARRAEDAGWHGMLVVDSQNLSGDSYVALTMAANATSRLGLGTGVTNNATRHPAVTAAAIASVQKISNGRACLGIGRGDSALAHLGSAPTRLRPFEKYIEVLQTYLSGGEVPFSESAIDPAIAPPVAELELADTPGFSRIQWLAGTNAQDKVPLEVAATGPKVIAIGARHAERIMFTLGADPERLRWGMEVARAAAAAHGRDPDTLSYGAYVNLACHPDRATARDLVRGGLTTFARFSVMHGEISGPVDASQTRVLNALHDSYDMNKHTRGDSRQAEVLTPEFIDRYAVVGTADEVLDKIGLLRSLGISKLAVSGPTVAAKAPAAQAAIEHLHREVIPNL